MFSGVGRPRSPTSPALITPSSHMAATMAASDLHIDRAGKKNLPVGAPQV